MGGGKATISRLYAGGIVREKEEVMLTISRLYAGGMMRKREEVMLTVSRLYCMLGV